MAGSSSSNSSGSEWLYRVTGESLFIVSPVWINWLLYFMGVGLSATVGYVGIQTLRGKPVAFGGGLLVGWSLVVGLLSLFLMYKLYQSQQAQYG